MGRHGKSFSDVAGFEPAPRWGVIQAEDSEGRYEIVVSVGELAGREPVHVELNVRDVPLPGPVHLLAGQQVCFGAKQGGRIEAELAYLEMHSAVVPADVMGIRFGGYEEGRLEAAIEAVFHGREPPEGPGSVAWTLHVELRHDAEAYRKAYGDRMLDKLRQIYYGWRM